MRKTLFGFCLLAGMSAAVSPAGAQSADMPLAEAASRWSSPLMERHAPPDFAQLQALRQKNFRYMDMAQGKPGKSISDAIGNAVIVRRPAHVAPGRTEQPQSSRHATQPGRASTSALPMT
ncbi:hypothetical protein [Herbaspirillum sp.]|uniref:hypothetical protein n=1 Tax=Herbaspirillum sp. TaxID=1890675 RepID=UPI0031D9C6B4